MHHNRTRYAAALLGAATCLMPLTTHAQGQDWFVPGQQKPAHPGASARGPARPQTVQAPPALVPPLDAAPSADPEQPTQPIQVELPPAPDVPAQPKGPPPPTAVIGVLGLGEISRTSIAAQAVDKTLNERMTKLQDDARKEQATWRDMQQQLASAKGLSQDQLRAKERELQERVTNAQRQFRDRNRIIQEAAQYARAQIERTLRQIVIRVSEAHGINVVLHQEQVVLNYPAFDITQEVVEVLNKVLPSVVVPPDGVSVSQLPGAAVPTAQAQPGATPAAAAMQAGQSPAAGAVPTGQAPTATATLPPVQPQAAGAAGPAPQPSGASASGATASGPAKAPSKHP